MDDYEPNAEGVTEVYDGFTVILCYSEVAGAGVSTE